VLSEHSHIKLGREDRFDRFRRISWWEQERLRASRVLVIGAGALGNEILKNLALLGVGQIFVADMDVIENSNLSRSILYRERDDGRRKAEVASERAREIYPETKTHWFHGDVVYELGLGVYRWADLVIAGLDNREARLQVNRNCWKANTPWIDGATEILQGVVRVFVPPEGPCYECTMSEADWQVLKQRHGCAGLRAEEMQLGRVPTTPTTASIIAGLECQEAVKMLHGLDVLRGKGMVFNGMTYDTYVVSYQTNEDCLSHETFEQVIKLDEAASQMTVRRMLALARTRLGQDAVLEFNHEILISFHCASCDKTEEVFRPLGSIAEREAKCAACEAMREVRSAQSVDGSEDFLERTLLEMGVPPFDYVIGRAGLEQIAFELSRDAALVLGPLYDEGGRA
jgi:molybdopterin/thiamine biosynthesis adenylyltransferase